MPRLFVTNQAQQEVKKEAEEVKVEPVIEVKPKKRIIKKAVEETGDTWEEKQES